jgi:hypothetical protein
MMQEKLETQEQNISSYESVNIPTYEEVLSFSGLSENQFSFDQYKQYKNRIQMRVRLIDEQLAYFESELSSYEKLSLSSTQEKLYLTCKEMISKAGLMRNTLMNQYDMFSTSDTSAVVEEKIEELSNFIREIKFLYASFSVHGNFQSVSVASSLHEELGEGQKVKKDLFTEYSRYDLDAKEAQNHFNSLIEAPDGYSSKSLFFSSGMAAVSTVLAGANRSKVLCGSSLYFENSNITHDYLDEETTTFFNEGETGSLREGVAKNPDVVFIEPIGNNFELPTVDLKELFETESVPKVVILDVTLFGLGFDYEKFLSESKDGSTFIFVNSLQKLFQDGDSVVSAGAITIVGKDREYVEALRSKIYALRGMLGTNITQHSLQGLLKLDRNVTLEYVQACVENTKSIFNNVKDYVSYDFGRVVYSEIPEGAPPVFYINFNQELGQQFVNRVVDLASNKGIQVTDGASFGFRHTRLMCIGGDSTKVRVCPGIENEREVVALTQIIQQSLNELEAENYLQFIS